MKDKFIMNVRVFAMILLVASISGCTKKGVEGFQDLKWGMSIEEVKKDKSWASGNLVNSGTKGQDVVFSGSVEVQGEKIPKSTALFLDGKLIGITLDMLLTVENANSYSKLLESKYGDGNQKLQESQLTAIKTGIDPQISMSWLNDTVYLHNSILNGVKVLAIGYRKPGGRESLIEKIKDL